MILLGHGIAKQLKGGMFPMDPVLIKYVHVIPMLVREPASARLVLVLERVLFLVIKTILKPALREGGVTTGVYRVIKIPFPMQTRACGNAKPVPSDHTLMTTRGKLRVGFVRRVTA